MEERAIAVRFAQAVHKRLAVGELDRRVAAAKIDPSDHAGRSPGDLGRTRRRRFELGSVDP